jgi:hypothetical protein
MLFCWLFGHRYDYELNRRKSLALICTKCGHWLVLIETETAEPKTVLDEVRQKIWREEG